MSKWRIARLLKDRTTFEFWNERASEWTTVAGNATLYDSKPVTAFDTKGGRCWAEIIRGSKS